MVIKNANELASSPLRKQALLIAEAAFSAINTTNLFRDHFFYDPKKDVMIIKGNTYPLTSFKRVFLCGVGKVAFEAARSIQEEMDGRIGGGVVIDIVSGEIPGLSVHQGTHPLPSEQNYKASKELFDLVSGCNEQDLIIMITSGGASSLFTLPAQITIDEERNITQALLKSGATINEINVIRKHLSSVKGGQLAKAAYPASVLNLVFSDVPGDDLSTIASGPLVMDHSTAFDAMTLMNKYHVLELCDMYSCNIHETPKDEKYFEKVENILFCSGKDALRAMVGKAADLGLKPRVWSEAFTGEAKEIGPAVVMAAQKGQCILGVGESTVTMAKENMGKGGRNQEMAVSALLAMPDQCVFAAVASDGRDNSDAAGGIVDQSMLLEAKNQHLDLQTALAKHDEYDALQQMGGLLQTGITGSNISDFFICIKQ